MNAAQVTRALRRLNVPVDKADAAGARYERENSRSLTLRRARALHVVDVTQTACTGALCDDTLTLTLPYPPRTKKNHGRGVAKQSAAFVRFRRQVIDGLAPIVERLGLPLPTATYNLAAVYFVDRYGERADLVGLHQALCDVLENARVVENDWQFRTLDGSRVIAGDSRPRVDLLISPITPRA